MRPDLARRISFGPYLEGRPGAEAWLRAAREYRRRFLDPVAGALDRRLLLEPDHHPAELVSAACEYGLLSLPIPAFLGGGGASVLECAIVLEELCAGCAGIANIFGAHYLGVSAILLGLDLSHYDRALHDVVQGERRGEPVVLSAAVTEPMAGTDVEDAELLPRAKLVTVALPVRGGYRLEGRKIFISNGSVARYHVVICATDRRKPLASWSAFVVPSDTPGFSVARVERKMGMRACHAAEIVFDGCFVPRENRIGIEGKAMTCTEVVLAASRPPVAAIATGIARGAYERALALCARRRCGAAAMLDRQWVQMALADLCAWVELARGIYLHAADAFDALVMEPLMRGARALEPALRALGPARRSRLGRRLFASETFRRAAVRRFESALPDTVRGACLGLSSAAKFSASDLAVRTCLRAIELFGPGGAEERNEVEKLLRDAKLTQIYEGTNQLNRWETYKSTVREDEHGCRGA
jgi:alkylation response protein AidB-like acyl-CoA dehydrogenase